MMKYVQPTADVVLFRAMEEIATTTDDPNDNVLPLPGDDLSFGEGVEPWD